jgi:hypothetical protein
MRKERLNALWAGASCLFVAVSLGIYPAGYFMYLVVRYCVPEHRWGGAALGVSISILFCWLSSMFAAKAYELLRKK